MTDLLRTSIIKAPISFKNFVQSIDVDPKKLESSLSKLNFSNDSSRIWSVEDLQVLLEDLQYPYISNSTFNLDYSGDLHPRTPVVSFIGHIDHGKTTLMDYLTKSKKAKGEYGKITQHIGAHTCYLEGGRITILDTPGHRAFSAIRTMSAKLSDIVVLVIASDAGLQKETLECIDFIKKNDLDCMIALTKCDLEGLDPSIIQDQLLKAEMLTEDYGGNVQKVSVSAVTGEGIDHLKEIISLKAEILELKSRLDGPSTGYVLESKFQASTGVKTSLLSIKGRLRLKDIVVCNKKYGSVKWIVDEKGKRIQFAEVAQPVEVVGLPQFDIGYPFYVVDSVKTAKVLTSLQADSERHEQESAASKSKESDFDMFQSILATKKNTCLILRADTAGSLKALKKEILHLEPHFDILSAGVDNITLSDLQFAEDTGAIVLGFNVKQLVSSKGLKDVKVVVGRTIYKIAEELDEIIKQKIEDKESDVEGRATVIKVFCHKGSYIAGCRVVKGKLKVKSKVSIFRDDEMYAERTIKSIKIGISKVQVSGEQSECGLVLEKYVPKEGDTIEAFK